MPQLSPFLLSPSTDPTSARATSDASRSCQFPAPGVADPLDREVAAEPGRLEGSRRRLRPEEEEQFATPGTLASARGEEQGQRARIEKGDRAEVDDDKIG